MPAGQAPDEISEPVQHESPSEEEMPAPPHGEIAMAGQRDCPRKAPLLEAPVGVDDNAEYAGGVEAVAEHHGDALDGVAADQFLNGSFELAKSEFLNGCLMIVLRKVAPARQERHR